MNENSYSSLDIKELLALLWKRKYIIILCVILVAAAAFVKVTFLTADRYSSNGTLYISSKDDSAINISSISNTDFASSREMVPTCIEILRGRSFLTTVSQDIEKKYTWEQLKEMISMAAVNGTEVLEISVTSLDPEDSYMIAESIIRLAPDKIYDVLQQRGKVSVIDEAVRDNEPIRPNLITWLFLGIIAGSFIGVVIILLINLFDRKIRKSSDIEKRYDVPVLGEINY